MPQAGAAAPAAAAAGGAQQQQPAAAAAAAPVDQPFDMFGNAPAGGAAAQAAAGGPLAALRNNPQFQALRAVVQQRPELLQPMLAVSVAPRAGQPCPASHHRQCLCIQPTVLQWLPGGMACRLPHPPTCFGLYHPPTYLPALPCPPHTQELGKTNPAMLEAINGNQEEFLAMINEPLGEGEGGMEALMQQLAGEMGDGERGGGGRWGVG